MTKETQRLLDELAKWEQLASLTDARDRERYGGHDACKRKREEATAALVKHIEALGG